MSEKQDKDLKAWQEASELTKMIYDVTESFPQSERFGLANQMKRAAASIESSIEQCQARITEREKMQYFAIARGFLREVDTQIEISQELGLLNNSEKIIKKINEVSLLLYGLIKKASNISEKLEKSKGN